MDHAPTIDTALIPGIRRLISVRELVGTGASNVWASPILAARSVLRTLLFAVNADLNNAILVTLELAYVNTQTPVAADFIGTNRILPDSAAIDADPNYPAQGQNSAADLPVSLQLPERAGRLIGRITNSTAFTVNVHIRMVIDGLGQLGPNNGSR